MHIVLQRRKLRIKPIINFGLKYRLRYESINRIDEKNFACGKYFSFLVAKLYKILILKHDISSLISNLVFIVYCFLIMNIWILFDVMVKSRSTSLCSKIYLLVILMFLFYGKLVQPYDHQSYNDNTHTAYNSIYYSPDLSGKLGC